MSAHRRALRHGKDDIIIRQRHEDCAPYGKASRQLSFLIAQKVWAGHTINEERSRLTAHPKRVLSSPSSSSKDILFQAYCRGEPRFIRMRQG